MLGIFNTRWFTSRYWHDFPYTTAVLNSVLKDKYDVEILDANIEDLTIEKVKERIKKFKPDIFGVTCLSMQYAREFNKIISTAKLVYPKTKIIVGGIYPTLLPELVMKNKDINYAVLGEGEYRFPKLLKYLETNKPSIEQIDGIAYRSNEKIIIQPVKNYIEDLDSLPLPFYNNLDFYTYANKVNPYSPYMLPQRFPYAFTITSRGCPFDCIFCSSKAINGPKIRYRSADSVLKEIDWLIKKYGIKEIIFLDDNFFLNRDRLKKILYGLIERNYDLKWKTVNAAVYILDDEILELMKKSGCYQIGLAIESGTLEGLKLINKPLPEKILSNIKHIVKKAKSLDFELLAMFVIGTPGETWEQIRETFNLADNLDLDYCSFNICTPLPKTRLYKIAKEKKLLPKNFDFDNPHFYGFGKANITTNEFTPKELQILRAYEWDRINFKTKEKEKKIARLAGITLKELKNWRVSTRRAMGIDIEYKNNNLSNHKK